MDVKSAFLNQYLNKELYVEQPKGFVDPSYPDYGYKLNKVLYGLKQAPKAQYERLTQFLVKQSQGKFVIVQIYVYGIVFSGMSQEMVELFVEQMKEFEMSMVGELTYFLGFQIKQLSEGIFISQSKYAKSIVKKFGLERTSIKQTLVPTHAKITKDSDGAQVNESYIEVSLEAYCI